MPDPTHAEAREDALIASHAEREGIFNAFGEIRCVAGAGIEANETMLAPVTPPPVGPSRSHCAAICGPSE